VIPDPQEAVMSVKSWRWVAIGAVIAVIVPASFGIFGLLLQARVIHFVRGEYTMERLTTIALTEAFLGPIGIVIAGRSAGLRHPVAWLALFVVAVPLLAVMWFLCMATLSGALGSPF